MKKHLGAVLLVVPLLILVAVFCFTGCAHVERIDKFHVETCVKQTGGGKKPCTWQGQSQDLYKMSDGSLRWK